MTNNDNRYFQLRAESHRLAERLAKGNTKETIARWAEERLETLKNEMENAAFAKADESPQSPAHTRKRRDNDLNKATVAYAQQLAVVKALWGC